MKRVFGMVWRGALVLAALMAVVAGCEDLWLRYRMSHGAATNLFDQVTIIDAGEVKGGKLEYYMDRPQLQQCIHAIFPHFGNAPCWYLKRHTTNVISRGGWPGVPAAAGPAAGVQSDGEENTQTTATSNRRAAPQAAFRERAARSWT